MDTLERHHVAIGRFAWVMAWFALVAGQLHALARHRTADGKGDLDLVTTRFWAEPAGRALRPLFDWGNPDVVYVTYGKIWFPVFAAFFLCALLTFRRRRPAGFEKGVWWVVLVAYGVAVVDVFAEYWTSWTSVSYGLIDTIFAVTLPAVAVTILGSTVLGITLLRKGFRPLLPAWLLTLELPLAILITQLTSMGNIVLPIAFAFGILGRRSAHEEPVQSPTVPSMASRIRSA
jgi:hypothetical protein